MPRYKLRTLLIVLAIGPPIAAWVCIYALKPWIDLAPSPITLSRNRVELLREAVLAYSIQVGALPPDLQSLLIPPLSLPNPVRWQGPYLDEDQLPLDPWGKPFGYSVVDPVRDQFRIWSNGPDRQPQTADDIFALDVSMASE